MEKEAHLAKGFNNIAKWGVIEPGTAINKGAILFPKEDSDKQSPLRGTQQVIHAARDVASDKGKAKKWIC